MANKKWHDTSLVEKVISNYTSFQKFREENSGLYGYLCRKKIMLEMTKNLKRETKPRGYWRDLDNIKAEMKSVKTRKELKERRGLVTGMKALGVYKEMTDHLPREVNPRNYWAIIENLRKEARKYNRKVDFSKCNNTAYDASIKSGRHEEICAHMENNIDDGPRYLYAFEFPDKSAYVGVTKNIDQRYKEHMRDHKRIIKKTKKQGHVFFEYIKTYNKDNATAAEESLRQEYINMGWKLMNKVRCTSIGGGAPIWNDKNLREYASGCTTKKEFREKKPGARGAAVRLGIYKEITEHMKPLRKRNYYKSK